MALSELADPQAIRDAIDEFDRLSGPVFRSRYGFGKAKEYMLRTETGRLYDSKAIAGVAFGYQFPDRGPLKPADFTGGENTVQRKLEELGFEVVRVGEVWSRDEVERAVGDYLDMLALEAKGIAYNKSSHNEFLRRHLTARTKASVELKHQNISAVLDELGLPFIQGYKPRSNVQALLQVISGLVEHVLVVDPSIGSQCGIPRLATMSFVPQRTFDAGSARRVPRSDPDAAVRAGRTERTIDRSPVRQRLRWTERVETYTEVAPAAGMVLWTSCKRPTR